MWLEPPDELLEELELELLPQAASSVTAPKQITAAIPARKRLF